MKCEGVWFVFHLGLFAHLWGLCLHNETETIVSSVFGLGLVEPEGTCLPKARLLQVEF